jgi:hypothetical protein
VAHLAAPADQPPAPAAKAARAAPKPLPPAAKRSKPGGRGNGRLHPDGVVVDLASGADDTDAQFERF